jgi:hypothetical protein
MLTGARTSGQSNTIGEFWPAIDAHVEFAHDWRLLAFVGLKKGEEFAYQQLNAGAGFGYQWKTISKPHLENIDPDKEHTFIFAGGYERLQTLQSGTPSDENRLALQAVAGFRPISRLFVSDRNRVEFRWVNGVYSTRYRNLLFGLYDIKIHEFRFSPYASAEAFYNGAVGSWNEEQYTVGVEWPYKRLLMLQTYYLRENCTTCNPAHLNVAGLTLNLFF